MSIRGPIPCLILLTCLLLGLSSRTNAAETADQFAQRTKWWREAKFGMFIHWGIYAVPADSTDRNGNRGIGEWYLSNKQMQVADYAKFAAQFNPVKFDANRWARTAKAAGMNYIVITSKHHDGFCLFDSKLTDYCITKATPFKRDPLKELAEACRKEGIRLCFYHSIMDWHHPDYLPRRPWEGANRPAEGANLSRYIDYMKGQLRELLTNYGPIGVIWFDGGWEHNAQELRSQEVNAMIRSIQPGIILNDRNQLPEDHSTPEQTIPANALPGGRLWETCMTINDTWGFARNDTNWKSAADLIRKLCDIAHKGGNFLLNVGPTAEGTFPDAIHERLARMGAWMQVNSESIYGTTKSPFRRLSFDGRCTVKGNLLYLHVFNWPEEGLVLKGLKTPVRSAVALNGNERLRARAADGPENALFIDRPARLDADATVIRLRLAGSPVVEDVASAVQPDAQGALTLKAAEAEIHGQTAQYEQGGGKDNIGFWTNAADYVTWTVRIPAKGAYRVEITYACPEENAGSAFMIGAEPIKSGMKPEGSVKATGSWTDFKTEPYGTIPLEAGKQTLSVRITTMPRGAAMNLQSVRLVPASNR